jgi:hypothetical protein
VRGWRRHQHRGPDHARCSSHQCEVRVPGTPGIPSLYGVQVSVRDQGTSRRDQRPYLAVPTCQSLCLACGRNGTLSVILGYCSRVSDERAGGLGRCATGGSIWLEEAVGTCSCRKSRQIVGWRWWSGCVGACQAVVRPCASAKKAKQVKSEATVGLSPQALLRCVMVWGSRCVSLLRCARPRRQPAARSRRALALSGALVASCGVARSHVSSSCYPHVARQTLPGQHLSWPRWRFLVRTRDFRLRSWAITRGLFRRVDIQGACRVRASAVSGQELLGRVRGLACVARAPFRAPGQTVS